MREKTAEELAEKQRIQKKTDEDLRLECIESGNTAPRTNGHLADTDDQTEKQYRLAAIETVEERNASPGTTAPHKDAGIIESERRKERSSSQMQTEARLGEEANGSMMKRSRAARTRRESPPNWDSSDFRRPKVG